jgi:hypothetical protein
MHAFYMHVRQCCNIALRGGSLLPRIEAAVKTGALDL